jgi:MinD-like ATPase involved in chromosome partitioning or flagellar assembly
MSDQAEALRKMVLQTAAPGQPLRRGSMMLVFGAEAAMGASVLSVQLAVGWRRLNQASALVEMRRHRPPQRMLSASHSRATLRDVVQEDRTLREAWSTGPCGLPIVAGDLEDQPLHGHHPLIQQLRQAAEQQHLLLDVEAIDDLRILLPVADHCLFVTTAEPEMLTATYRAIKRAVAALQGARCWLVMSQVIDPLGALELQARIVTTCDRCLNLALTPLGYVPWDPALSNDNEMAAPVWGSLGPSAYRQAVDPILARIDAATRSAVRRCTAANTV